MRRVTVFAQEGSRRAAGAWARANAQPSWVVRAALAVLFLVIALPVLLLMLLAIAAAMIVFVVLAFVNRVLTAIRAVFMPGRDDEGRENVRIVRRDQ
jgi:hypothetical protein